MNKVIQKITEVVESYEKVNLVEVESGNVLIKFNASIWGDISPSNKSVSLYQGNKEYSSEQEQVDVLHEVFGEHEFSDLVSNKYYGIYMPFTEEDEETHAKIASMLKKFLDYRLARTRVEHK